MANNRWHLLSTFETEDSLDMFCRKAGFIRDKDEKYLYVLKDGVERGVEMKREDWIRISISEGKKYEFRDGEWSDSSTFSTTTMPKRASIWIFGAEDGYTPLRQRFEKAVQKFKDYFYILNRYDDMDRDLRELFVGSDNEDGVLEQLRKVKKELEEQTEYNEIKGGWINRDTNKVVMELDEIFYNDYHEGRDYDGFSPTNEGQSKQRIILIQYLERFVDWYGEDESRLSRYQRAQEIIDFSDEDYGNWKQQ